MRPLAHFLLLGLALFALDRVRARFGVPEARERIEIDAARLEQIERQWMREMRTPPTPQELEALVRDAVDEEILFREAIGLGLLETDAVVRMRLVQNARFIGLAQADEQALFEEALALGLQFTDPVVRRRLVQRVRMGIAERVRETPVSEGELEASYAAERERYVLPATVELWHVFFGREPDGAHAARAARALERIRSRRLAPEQAVGEGDPFLRGHHLARRSLRELEAVFGPDLPPRVFALAPGAWSEPIESAYGLHLVFVSARAPERVQPLEEVRSRVAEEVYARREREALRAALDEVRARYDVRIAAAAGSGS